jgi:FecR protein
MVDAMTRMVDAMTCNRSCRRLTSGKVGKVGKDFCETVDSFAQSRVWPAAQSPGGVVSMQPMKHITFKRRALSCMLVASGLVLSGTALAQAVGQIEKSEGYARLVGPKGDRTVSATVAVEEGDRLITSANSEAVVRMNDGAVLAVRPNSELIIAAYKFDKQSPKNSNVLLELIRGGLRKVTGVVGKVNPNAVKVSTPTATIGIRGTDFESAQIDNTSVAMGSTIPPGNYTRTFTGRTVVGDKTSGSQVEVGAGQAAYSPNRSFGTTVPFGLIQAIPSGVFSGGKLDGSLPAVQRQMMRSLSDEFRNNMPDELKGVIPDFGTMAPPPKKK